MDHSETRNYGIFETSPHNDIQIVRYNDARVVCSCAGIQTKIDAPSYPLHNSLAG
jgi:hypothetical protein